MTQYRILKSEADYHTATDNAIKIFDAVPGSTHFEELEVLLLLIKDYEEKHYPIPTPNPLEAIKLKMDEKGFKNKDLVGVLGSEGHVSAILSGKRNLTLPMAKQLCSLLGIPAEIFLGSPT